MAFIGTKNLAELLTTSDVIKPFQKSRIKNGAYELCLGEQIFLTDSSPRQVKEIKEGAQIEIKPGQFALLLTKEYIKVPTNKIAFISIKATVKFKGLINVSGFHVDPGFEGNLLFSVYNAGPSNIILSSGTAYFPIWFSELNEDQEYEGSHDNQVRIPDGPIEALSQGELASPNSLSKRIDENQKESDRKIGLLEKEITAKDYLIKTVLGIVLVLLVKFGFDWFAYDNGFKKASELKEREVILNSQINNLLTEKKKLLTEIDSLKSSKSAIKIQN